MSVVNFLIFSLVWLQSILLKLQWNCVETVKKSYHKNLEEMQDARKYFVQSF